MSAILIWAIVATLLAVIAVAVLLSQQAARRSALAAQAQTAQALREAQRALDIAQATDSERRRIYDDLHDDVGGKLLTLLHQVRDPEQTELVRAALQDLRDIVSRSRSISGSLWEVLALLREETERRLDALGTALIWLQSDAVEDPTLDDAQAMHLFRIGRESVTNAMRHARPQTLRIVIEQVGCDLVFEVTDDGAFQPDRVGAGRGTQSMQTRATQLKGNIAWVEGTLGGTKVRLRFPLPPASAG